MNIANPKMRRKCPKNLRVSLFSAKGKGGNQKRVRRQSFFKRSKRFKRFKRFKRKNVDDEGNRKKYKNTEKQHENGKYDKWVVLIKPHNGCDAFRILIRNCK